MRKSKIALVASGLCLFLYGGTAFVSHYLVNSVLAPKLHDVSLDVATHHKEILEDLKRLEANPIFADGARTKDAQEFLSRHVGWESSKVPPVKDHALELLSDLRKDHQKLSTDTEVKALFDDPRLMKIDVSWVDDLPNYDHWNFATSPVVADEIKRAEAMNGVERIGVIASMPVPDYTKFYFASTVRFLQLQHDGQGEKGLKLMRHASYLAHTSPTLIGAMIAIANVNRERKLAEYFGIKSWQTIDAERAQAYRRVSWAWGALMHEASWDTLPKEFEAYMKPQNGLCAMAGERYLGDGFKDFFEANAPFETRFTDHLKKSDALTARLFDICSLDAYRPLLKSSPPESNPFFVQNEEWHGLNPVRFPFFRRVLGMTILTIATPNWLGQYEKRTPAATQEEKK